MNDRDKEELTDVICGAIGLVLVMFAGGLLAGLA